MNSLTTVRHKNCRAEISGFVVLIRFFPYARLHNNKVNVVNRKLTCVRIISDPRAKFVLRLRPFKAKLINLINGEAMVS